MIKSVHCKTAINFPDRAKLLFYSLKFIEITNIKGKPISDIRLAFALFTKINSNVQMYVDELIFVKSELISYCLTSKHQKRGFRASFLIHFISYIYNFNTHIFRITKCKTCSAFLHKAKCNTK